ncbi:hypothetical protein EMCRGX_G014165 [Ephydatia muelleri]
MDSTSLAWGQIFKDDNGLCPFCIFLVITALFVESGVSIHFYQVTTDTKDFRSSVWRLLVHLFLSGGLTAVLSVSLLASKRLQPYYHFGSTCIRLAAIGLLIYVLTKIYKLD